MESDKRKNHKRNKLDIKHIGMAAESNSHVSNQIDNTHATICPRPRGQI